MTLSTFCLALVVYTEARGESYQGQVMVAEVVINRVDHDSYPDNVCGVAFQKRQFSGMTSDISIDEPEAWDTAVSVAFSVMEGYATGTKATHFHTNSASPVWASKLERLDTVGGHTFYSE
jgi:spore germination cell wall hydrolase CwlJ-like protein